MTTGAIKRLARDLRRTPPRERPQVKRDLESALECGTDESQRFAALALAGLEALETGQDVQAAVWAGHIYMVAFRAGIGRGEQRVRDRINAWHSGRRRS
jgi:hypothetical protein